jgi:hypothetical protein
MNLNVEKTQTGWSVVNRDKGTVMATCTSHYMAKRVLRALYVWAAVRRVNERLKQNAQE